MAGINKKQKTIDFLIADLELIAMRNTYDLYRVMSAVIESAAYLAARAKLPEALFVKNARAYYRQEKAICETMQRDLKAVAKRMKDAERAIEQVTKTKKRPSVRKGTVRK